jgi:ABC-type sugar transport system ATPase subunit
MAENGLALANVSPQRATGAKEGVLGIRPKHVEWQPSATSEGPWLPGIVQETDDTGDDTLIYADIGEQSIKILERHGRSVRAGDRIGVRFPTEFVHLFVDGKRIDVDSTSVLAEAG